MSSNPLIPRENLWRIVKRKRRHQTQQYKAKVAFKASWFNALTATARVRINLLSRGISVAIGGGRHESIPVSVTKCCFEQHAPH